MQTNKHRMAEERETNASQQLLLKYVPYWPLFILFALVALTGAYIYLHFKTPIYEAKATLIIKDEKRGTEDSKTITSLNTISANKNVENEIEVIHSIAIMEKVVKNLFLYIPIFEQGKVKAGDAYAISPIMIEAQNPDSVTEAQKVNLSYDKASQTVTLDNQSKYPINQFVKTAYGILKFMPNKYDFASASLNKQLYFSILQPVDVAPRLLKSLIVSAGKQSAIVTLSYKDAIPQRAIDILNELLTVYAQTSINDKNALALNTMNFVNEQLTQVVKELDSIEKKVQRYKSGSGAVDISTQGQYVLKNVSENDQKLGDVNSRLAALGEVERSVASKENSASIVPATVGIGDPMLSNLMTKLYDSEMEYDKLKKTVGENHPSLLSLSEQINKMRPSILENIQSQKQSLDAARRSLSATNGGYNSMLQSVPQKEQQILSISRELAVKNQQYALLLQRRQESELSLASTVSSSRVVDKAQAGKDPVSPKKNLIYMMAVIGALGFCTVLITVKDSFTGKIKYRKEIESLTSIPIIGEIAFDKSKTPLVIEKGTRSFVAEEFRKLRISLSFLGIDSAHKKLLLTSSISGEGKSFIAANLAVSLSLTGKKVVLVDLDLNNPSLSKILDVDQEYGITEVLTGEKSIDSVIKKVDGQETLYFISAGNLPENPTELLSNGKINAIVDYLDSNFDMVLIDTSPAVLVTDAYILSGLCDATLYVIRHDYTPKMLVKRIDENNQINPINNAAIVFNGVKTRGVFKNNYGYGYDYVYGNKERGVKTKKVS